MENEIAEEVNRLRRCMNDLVSVLALPAMWTGLDLSGVAAVFLDGLVRVLELDFGYLWASDADDGSTREWIRVARGGTGSPAQKIGRVLEPYLANHPSYPRRIAHPTGEGLASIEVCQLGIQERIGTLVAGSRRTDFPNEEERLLLQVATNLAAIALKEGRRIAQEDAAVELERRRAEAALRASESRFRQLADNLPEVIWITALDTEKVLYCSPSFEAIWGLKVQDLYREARLWTWAIHPEDRDRVVSTFSEWIAGKEINYHDVEFRIVRPDGGVRWIHERGVLTRDENGRPIEVSGISADVTAAKQAQQALQTAFEQISVLKDQLYKENVSLREEIEREVARRYSELEVMNKELEAFAYSVSHDLRAPLRHMSGYSELLQKKATSIQLDAACQRYITIIIESANRMGNLIDDLLAFSRIGRAETQKSEVDLSQLVMEVVNELREETGGRDIVWKVDALPKFYGDRSMLRVVLVNLVSNAVKFTKTRSQAEIEIGSLNRNAGESVVFVKDNGVGFDMKYANKLFGVFQRLHEADTFEGTGIGLATVQRIIHRHGGRVWAEGGVDKGATFYFSLSK